MTWTCSGKGSHPKFANFAFKRCRFSSDLIASRAKLRSRLDRLVGCWELTQRQGRYTMAPRSQLLKTFHFGGRQVQKQGVLFGVQVCDLFPDLYHLFISFLFTCELVHLLNDLFDSVHLCTLLCRYIFDHWFTRSFSHLVMIFCLDYFFHCFRLDAFTLLHISLYMPPSVTHVLIC